MLNIRINNQAFSLVEVIVAVAVFAMLAAGVFHIVTNSYSNYYGTGDKQVASDYAQEGLEAVKSIKESGWQTIVDAVGANGLTKDSNSAWAFSGASDTLNDFTRVITIANAQRDSNWNIVDAGGTDDPYTKKVTVTISGTGMDDYTLNTYLTDWNHKTWTQTDWSGVGDSEFWSNITMASSSFSTISTSTAGEISLSKVAGGTSFSWGGWSDLTPDATAKYKAWEDFYGYQLGPEGDSLYLTGTSNYDFVKYDISRVQAGIMSPEWKITVPWHTLNLALHPSGDYAYLGTRDFRNGPTYDWDMVCIANLQTLAAVTSANCHIGTVPANDSRYANVLLVNEAGTKLYVFDSYGFGHVFDISDGGATLTLVNDSQGLTSTNSEWSYQINAAYLDESGAEPYVYIFSDDGAGEFRKFGFDGDFFSSTSTNAYVDSSYSPDFTDAFYLGQYSGKNRFIVGTEGSTQEMIIVEDQGTSLTEIGSYNLSTSQLYAEVVYDPDTETGFIYYYSPNGLYSVDLSDMATPVDGEFSNTSMNRKSNYRAYDQIRYSTTTRGLFLHDHRPDNAAATDDDRVNLHYIGRDMTRASGLNYSYSRTITLGLDSTVSGASHSDFPIVISEADDYLKSAAHGGKVQSDLGYDIIFASDSDGETLLSHEIEGYSSSTGKFTAWVKIPTLAADTDIYMFYGNSSISSTQENISDVWSNDYKIVQHMVDSGKAGTRSSAHSSNGGFKYAEDSPTEVTEGKIGRSQSFDGSYDYITIEHNLDTEPQFSDFTIEFWMKPSSSGAQYSSPMYFGNGDVDDADGFVIRHHAQSTDKLQYHMGDDNTYNLGGFYLRDTGITDDVWTYVALTIDRDVGYQAYFDTLAGNSYARDTSTSTIGEVYDVTFGKDWSSTNYFYTGELDEMRVSSTTRSTDWMTTGYNNMNSTSTFYSIGSESLSGVYADSGSIYSSIFDIGSSDKDLRSITVDQNIPSGCGLQLTLESADNAAMSGAASQVFDDVSTNIYTSTTPAILDGKRYLRYKAYLTNCSAGANTATLYSVKLDYR
ncbi:DUF2341 domain-containing protein [Candidatus Parcubacteria bacterium]|jgi:prepilin-type N-terminal cleavage/methylation domain-containing protein|nr:DUF2341 domain-containing protein [Candidatus Parcubacteria bacterium]